MKVFSMEEIMKEIMEGIKGGFISYHVKCEPVIDILSANILFADTNTSFDVCSYITIQDGSNKNLVYRHKSPLSQKTRIPHFLHFSQLSNPEEIPSLNEPCLHVDIFDDKSGRSLFCGEKRLFKTNTPKLYSLDKFERIDTLQFQFLDGEGGSGHLEVNYVAFTFGVFARVKVLLCKDDAADYDEKGVEVFGQIYAKFNPLILPNKCYENHMFNVIEEDHEWVGLGDKIVLYKDFVAVPIYSDLEISVDLKKYKDTGSIVHGTAYFGPINNRNHRKVIQGVKGYYVTVQVSWYEPSFLEEPWCAKDLDTFSLAMPLPKQPKNRVSPILEVFSLFIYCPLEVRLCGSVRIFDSSGSCDIFTCSENEPYILACGCNWLPLEGPNRAIIPSKSFRFKIDLSDISGVKKIQGYAESTFGFIDNPRPWFNRRFSSVVRGDDEKSFVAVNFTLFPFAVEAILTVRLSFSKSFKIYGNITASYGMLPYSTKYDSEFFQSVLFTRNEANSLEIEEKLKLSRCVVAVPITSSLLTHVDLSFQSVEGTHHASENVRFKIGESSKVIVGTYVSIHIDVKWRGLPYV